MATINLNALKNTTEVVVVDPMEFKTTKPEQVVDGIIIINENKPEYGSIAFKEGGLKLGNGFVNNSTRVHFEQGSIANLKKLVEATGMKAGDTIENYKIVVKESNTPFYAGQECKINPSTKEELKDASGKPIYRDTLMLPVNDPNCKDELIQHVSATNTAKTASEPVKAESFAVAEEFANDIF